MWIQPEVPLNRLNDTTIPEHLDPHVDPAGRTTQSTEAEDTTQSTE
jgi:hypothetical protein